MPDQLNDEDITTTPNGGGHSVGADPDATDGGSDADGKDSGGGDGDATEGGGSAGDGDSSTDAD
jgi:hypothetical protein